MSVAAATSPAVSALSGPLAQICLEGRSLGLVPRTLAPGIAAEVGALIVGEARSERFEMSPLAARYEARCLAEAALGALAGDGQPGGVWPALTADVLLQIGAASRLREALDEIAPLRYRHLPLRVRIERVTSDGCRLFHVDQVALRMICTWHGAGSEWLPEHAFDRNGLGCGCNDHVRNMAAIQRIPTMAVAVMKGDRFPGEAGRGLVHRSPPASPDQPRLLMVVDIA